MSDHLDGYTARSQPQLDISDVYLFPGRTGGPVFVINVNPLSGPGGFHHEAIYCFQVDRSGGAVPDVSLRATFGDPDATGRQPFTLRLSTGKAAGDPAAQGRVVACGHTGQTVTSQGFRIYAGPAADPFFIEPSVVTACAIAVQTGSRLDLSGFDPSTAHNLFSGTNVQTIVIEAPASVFGLGRRISFWGATWVPLDDASGFRQVDRAANPLVSTLFGQDDPYGAAQPSGDAATYGPLIQKMTAAVVAANNSSPAPQKYGAVVAAALAPDVLQYTVGTEAYWNAVRQPGRPYARNGRDLVGNHANEAFRLVIGLPIDDRLTAADASGTLRPTFPYLSLPV